MNDAPKTKKCFVISPIGSTGDPFRIASDFFRHEIVEAALPDFVVKRADDFTKVDQITNQIIQAIMDANIIVADLTGPNANVFYELGVAHSYKKHVVPMIMEGQTIPFDTMAVRTIHYSLATYQTKQAARTALAAAVTATLAEEVSNPVTMALGNAQLAKSDDPVAEAIGSLTRDVGELKQRLNAVPPGFFGRPSPHSAMSLYDAEQSRRFDTAPEPPMPPSFGDELMHAQWEALLRDRFGQKWDTIPPHIKTNIRQSIGSLAQQGMATPQWGLTTADQIVAQWEASRIRK